MPERILYQFCGSGEMTGGVQDSTNSFAGFMREQGFDPHVFVGSSEDPKGTYGRFDSFDPDNIHILGETNRYITASGSKNPLGSVINPLKIFDELWGVDPDIFHINAPWMPHVGGLALRMAQRHGIPTFATYHIVSDKLITNSALLASGSIDSRLINNLTAMIAVSGPAREHMEMVYRYKGDVHIIPNGVDVVKFEEAKPFEANEPYEGFDPDRPTIVFVGRPDPRKGLDALLKTFKFLNASLPDSQLIVCGGDEKSMSVAEDKSLRRYVKLAKHLGISGNTRFVGYTSDTNKSRWFASADEAVLPATGNESQGIVLLEAMAAGAGVVVGGNNTGYASVFNQNDVRHSERMLIDPRAHRASSEHLLTLLTDDRAAREVYIEQQALVRRKYDIQVVGQQMLDLYDKLR